MFNANYNGKQANNTSYVKNFVYGIPANLWKALTYTKADGNVVGVITTTSPQYENVYIKGDLFVDGNIVSPSDINIKENLKPIDTDKTNKLLELKAFEYSFKDDLNAGRHFGFMAQDIEKVYPELVQNKPTELTKEIKSVNYLELIPILINKIQMMQEEINELKQINIQ